MCETAIEMPKYKCHKEVWALKIAKLEFSTSDRATGENEETDGGRIMTPADKGYGQFKLSPDYIRKHKPEVGGYYVLYKGGYESYSPADVFEDGYSLAQPNSEA